MRNKIKQLLNKEEGFTLIELLGVIVILGLIVAIAIPSIGGIIDNAKEDTKNNQKELIIDAAKMYEIGEDEKIGSDGVLLSKLVTEGYLEPLKGNSIYKESATVKFVDDTYEVE